jgi:hypothetical protein
MAEHGMNLATGESQLTVAVKQLYRRWQRQLGWFELVLELSAPRNDRASRRCRVRGARKKEDNWSCGFRNHFRSMSRTPREQTKTKPLISRFHLGPNFNLFHKAKNLQDAEFYREGEEER